MEQNQVIETIGSITKTEHLRSLQTDILPNSLVLKSMNPFPGVKNENETSFNKPGSLFVILRYRYAPEKINRINCKLNKKLNLTRFPSYGEIIHENSVFPCVRIKNLEDYNRIVSVQDCLRSNDLQLMAFKDIDADCRIKIFKFFKLAEIGDGLYRDLNEGEKIYIRIDSSINSKRFDSVINKIKYNLEESNFDAALGIIYRFQGPEHVIRIFDADKSFQRAVLLRKLFLKEIKDEIHLSASHKIKAL